MPLIGYEIPDNLQTEIDELESLISEFRDNSISEAELKVRRVPFGIYEQRKKGTYMVRIRCTAGIITPRQLKRVAELSLKFASGILHLTTRQEIQIHDVLIEDLVPVIRSLSEISLATRGGGGNTVRNITAPWDSGISYDEVFDVTPYAIALTSALIKRGDSWLLPRKYKIAFANSEKDTGYATVNDLGLIAQIEDGVKGFKVFAAGGMGRQSQPGHVLHDFVPGSQILLIAEAIKRLFSKNGNRKNKHAARLRFLWNTLGHDQFIKLYEAEKKMLINEDIESLKIGNFTNEIHIPEEITAINENSTEFIIWKNRYTGEQKQIGSNWVRIPVLFGMISAEKTKELANALISFGENTIRFTHDQNIALRNIPSSYLGNIYLVARNVSELSKGPVLFGNAVSCAGASTCQLGICRSRRALEAVVDRLKSSSIDLDKLAALRIHVSGCSNTCGQHMIADLGFFGKVGRKDPHSYPAYTIVAGVNLDINGGSQLAEKIDDINARDLPAFVESFLQLYSERKHKYSDFHDYLIKEGRTQIHELCERFRDIPSFDVDKSYYRDWGDTENFSLAGKGTGECSAGLFDLIEIDLAKLRQTRFTVLEKNDNSQLSKALYDLALVSSRMLLITRGTEAASDAEVFKMFLELFVKQGFVSEAYLSLIEQISNGINNDLLSLKSQIIALSNEVEQLYQNMDNSLQFKIRKAPLEATLLSTATVPSAAVDASKDFRGVACPMNFVKTKLALSRLNAGQVLQILLDNGPPIENVPKSVEAEGHVIMQQVSKGGYWVVTIKKAAP